MGITFQRIEMFKQNELNPQQKEAVEYKDGPLLIMAGAGSGKTRVITYRIAYLIGEYGIKPWSILGVTFTNKAASEMQQRVARLLHRKINDIMIRTFHSVCLRILRIEAAHIKLPSHFTIVDEEDKKSILKNIIDESEMDREIYNPKKIGEQISRWKSYEFTPEIEIQSTYEKEMFEIYRNYENYKKRTDCLDFDDLLLKTVELFKKEKTVLEKYRKKWQYILVDEFQDTNHIQYEFTRLLGEKHTNVCVVGDEDQSIYSWRGATPENFFRFQKDFPGFKIIKLEQNYRSTQNILDSATAVISNNIKRSDKKLWGTKGKGDYLRLYKFDQSRDEAEFVIREILNLVHRQDYQYNDIAIFYRTNYLSRSFEISCKGYHIPYVIIGGVRFFERKEIKDILAYLKLIANREDEVSLQRIINIPSRGIGTTTLNRLKDYAFENKVSLFKALLTSNKIEGVKKNIQEKIRSFVDLIQSISQDLKNLKLSEFVLFLIEETGYADYLKNFSPEEFESRRGNISELIQDIREREKKDPSLGLENYLEEASLQTSIDEWDSQDQTISLMTLHNAKGLEFKVVFIVGMQDGVFPHHRNLNEDPEDLEEERRLFYVGLTRARERIYTSYSVIRNFFQQNIPSEMSRFLEELPEDKLEFFDQSTLGKHSYSTMRFY
ncbi:MAG: exodeoxyribonuclease V subunit gamma [Spirochaetes bacterium]|nr:exodeoxyribonuclease V subunit gamma [Spirochaetota bacterium]